jgi:hypothetical protein
MSAAWIAVVASLGGVALGGAVNLIGEEIRARREARARHEDYLTQADEHRRSACVTFASAAREVWSRAWTLADYRLANPEGWRSDPFVQDLLETLEGAISRLGEAYFNLRILGTGSLAEHASHLHEAAVYATRGAYEETPSYPEAGINEQVDEFLDAAQAEIAGERASSSHGSSR